MNLHTICVFALFIGSTIACSSSLQPSSEHCIRYITDDDVKNDLLSHLSSFSVHENETPSKFIEISASVKIDSVICEKELLCSISGVQIEGNVTFATTRWMGEYSFCCRLLGWKKEMKN